MKISLDGFAIARVLAAGALILAGRRWPYSYYTVLRWLVCIVAVCGAIRASNSARKLWPWAFGALAVLFNPIAPIRFSRTTWTMLDIAAALILLISVLTLQSEKAPSK